MNKQILFSAHAEDSEELVTKLKVLHIGNSEKFITKLSDLCIEECPEFIIGEIRPEEVAPMIQFISVTPAK